MKSPNTIPIADGASANRYGWILSGGVIAAAAAMWATLIALLFRVGWLSEFGVSQDLYIPTSATELTYWGYMAMLEAWLAFQKDYLGFLLKLVGFTLAMICVGAGLGLATSKYRHRVAEISEKKTAQVSLAIAKLLGLSVLYPATFFYLVTTLLLSPLPAYFLAKGAAARTIQLYTSEVAAGKRNCHMLERSSGAIGACPMIIVQTADRIAFLDGRYVHVIPAEGISIRWELPSMPRDKRSTTEQAQKAK